MPFDDTTALVTGGAAGLRLAITEALAARGAKVAIFDIAGDLIDAQVERLRQDGLKVAGYVVDVSDRQEVESAVAQVRADLGPVLMLVNNAGIEQFGKFAEITDEQWDRVMAVNLRGPFICTQVVLPDMLEAQWGRIVNISSSSAQGGQSRMAAYVSSKAGVIGFTKSLALELGPKGITVNTIPPGMVVTPMLEKAIEEGASPPHWSTSPALRRCAARVAPKTLPTRRSSCARTGPTTSPGRSFPSTAVAVPESSRGRPGCALHSRLWPSWCSGTWTTSWPSTPRSRTEPWPTTFPSSPQWTPRGFALSLTMADGYTYESGDAACEFTIQSISKPFTYALALDQIGCAAVDAAIGVEPSGEAFNEISVDSATKMPKNPMINAGAIAAVSLIPASSPDARFALIRDFYSDFVGRRLELDDEVYRSEKATGSRNRAIGYMLQSFGVLDDDPDEVLDVYYRQCSLRVTATDLATMGATLARGASIPGSGGSPLPP